MSVRVENKEKTMGKQEAKVIGAVVGIVLLIIIIMMLLPFGDTVDPYPNNTTNQGGTPQGSWSVGDKREEQSLGPSTPQDSIAISGTDRYTVSSYRKEIELMNPEVNTVNFVFTITDGKTGEVIASEIQVAPGQYAYVNVFDHYKQAGQYPILIDIATFSFAGQQLNGANAKAIVTVVNN